MIEGKESLTAHRGFEGVNWGLGRSVVNGRYIPRVKRILVLAVAIAAAFAGLNWYDQTRPEAPEVSGPPIETPLRADSVDCISLTFNPKSIWSKRALENALIRDIRAQVVEFGHVDLDCLTREFQHLSPRTSTIRYPGGGFDGADVYRFKLDRSNNPIAIIWGGWGPGASNGKFVAIFNVTEDRKVAVIRVGGIPEWLRLESKEKP